MTTIKAFIRSHPLLSFYALAFAISWGGLIMVVGGPSEIPGTGGRYETLLPIVGPAMLAGPALAGIFLTGLLYGRVGFRNLLTRMRRWRVGARWWAVALLTGPLFMTAVLLVLSLISPEFLSGIFTSEDKATLLLFGIVAGVAVGIFEEIGWTGFAIPRMRQRYGVLATGLIVGLLWGAWHFLATFWSSGTSSGAISLAVLLPSVLFTTVGVLPAFRVLMVWVYDRSGSLLIAMLMHAGLSASTVILAVPMALALVPGLTYDLVLAAALWVFVAAVAVANHGHLSRHRPLPRRVA